MKRYWVIAEYEGDEEGARWIAFPANEETLKEVKEIAQLGTDRKIYVALELEEDNQ